ncbi:alpha/beta fold hydrolase [Lentzea tibetensis]|uniref:alpha/beta fold hydrolase n=1 Tax=Lentzea tibetensis TaxID=2591470 RepID=UPI00164643C3|nr:alpha/beta hydrolase [Lentzea tibetensis]
MDFVIAHGVQTTADHWAEVARRLPGRVLVPNRRGRADSPPIGPDYELRTEVDDLHRVLDTTEHPFLVGHSYGGLIALLAAAERDDLTALVLYEPVVPVDGPFAREPLKAITEALDAGDRDKAFEIVSIELIGDSPRYAEAFRTRNPVGWSAMLELIDSTRAEIEALDRFRYDPAVLEKITVPTTVLLGERTDRPELVYGRAARSLTREIEGAELVMLPDQGHIAHLTAPDLLADTITKFIQHR